MNAERIADAAVEWNAARIRALDLRHRRAAEVCEEESPAEPEVGLGASPPCWRQYRQTAPDDVELKPRAEWCAPCLRRQAIHEQYREAVQRRGIALRKIERLAVPEQSMSQQGETQ